MSEPQPPRPPEFKPGQATPPPYEPAPEYPPTSQFPPVNYAPPGQPADYGQTSHLPPDHGGYPPADYQPGPPGYGPPGYGPPGYGPPGYSPPPPRRSNKPLIAVILAVSVLLCGGVFTWGVLLVKRATEKVEEVAAPILEPTLPALPTGAPQLPGLPTDLPTDLPGLPTDLPQLPGLGTGKKITVKYEVDGDGPARILYTEKLGETPTVLDNVELPWSRTVEMESPAFASVTAQRVDTGNGSVTCRALIDDETATEQTTEGRFATATCFKLAID